MTNAIKPDCGFGSIELRLIIVVLLVLGLIFRFANLDRKVYWQDETWTSLWISGSWAGETKRQVFNGREIGIQDLRRYQSVNPEKGILGTVFSLALDDPKHPPLYYTLARLWAQLFGDSVWAIRSLSAVISLLVFPCLYWLCRELFKSSRTAWLVLALTAVSPFHVLYAQEAREYVLWTVTTLLASAALLRAIRLQTKRSWYVYAATVGLGLYSHTLFGLVIIAHGLYFAGIRWTTANQDKTARPGPLSDYLFATLVGTITFIPWASIILIRLTALYENTLWTSLEVQSSYLLKRWTLGLSSIFLDTSGSVIFDAKYGLDSPSTYLIRLLVLILMGYSFYFLYKRTSQRTWLFILTMVGATVIPLILLGLTFGWRGSSPARYWIPGYLAMQLSVAHLLAVQTDSQHVSRQRVWQAITAVLIIGGIVSCAVSSQARTWWNKGMGYELLQTARMVNQAARPLLISTSDSANFGNIIALSHMLDPKVRLRLGVKTEMLRIPDGFTDVFLLNPPVPLREKVEEEARYRIETVYAPGQLWQVAKNPEISSPPNSGGSLLKKTW